VAVSPFQSRLRSALLVLLSFLTLGFAWHAVSTGASGLVSPSESLGRLYGRLAPHANTAIALHMISGAVITVAAPLQVITALRVRWPGLHRAVGYVLITVSIFTAVTGVIYIASRGTIGGPVMTMGFTLYAVLMALAAIQTLRFARAKAFVAHRRWALRLFVLAIGSWLYRVHYGVWYALTGGVGSEPDFSGLFDQVQVFAFYLPYLLLLEVFLRKSPNPVQ